ncbi:hypothetical protein HZ99_26395 [Pseudomonas fluorescens]|nr:hypothetical protein HZ99_26395 [Pseudomonas fluorescens]
MTPPPPQGLAANQADDRTIPPPFALPHELASEDKRWNTRALIVDDDVPIRELLSAWAKVLRCKCSPWPCVRA